MCYAAPMILSSPMKILVPAILIIYSLFTALDSAFGQTWTNTSAPYMIWFSVASSADGAKLVAVAFENTEGNPGSIFTSTNSGAIWTQTRAPSNIWVSVASSADGTKLVAAPHTVPTPAPIYLSKDSGATWSSNNTPNAEWYSLASSADGTKLVAVGSVYAPYRGVVYTSADSGSTWGSNNLPVVPYYWFSVASSADGNKLVVVSQYGQICTSTNSGATWQQAVNAPGNSNIWDSVASSADGSKLVAVSQYQVPAYSGSIYTSTDSGMTWNSNNAPSLLWESVASSADGTKLVAVGYSSLAGGVACISTNAGVTWTQASAGNNFGTVAMSADGNRLFAINGGGISGGPGTVYTAYFTPSPVLNINPLPTNLKLSWTVPSTNFVLQQNSDLTTTNWVTLTNTPVLDLTNLQDQVILSPTNSSGFFRLISQ